MKKDKFYFIFLLWFCSTATAQHKHFVLYHLVHYVNTPTSLQPYLQPTTIAYEHTLLYPDSTLNVAAVRAFALSCKPGVPATLDIEVWPYWPDTRLTKTINNFLAAITAFKQVNTTSPISFYGVPPKQAYLWKNIDPVHHPKGYETWRRNNDSLSRVAAKVDIFLPSFYTHDTDTAAWHKMVDTTIAAIKRYNTTKPVYAYIWPQYHEGYDYSLQFIDTAVWKYELRVLYHCVDGCIVWTSNKDSHGNRIFWDPNMLWWQATKAFMTEQSLTPPFVLDSFYLNRSGNKVNLRWATATDTVSDNFIVQRSSDSYHFRNVSKPILSLHSYYTVNEYAFTDKLSPKRKTYYRLQIKDKMGGVQYSPVIADVE